MKLNHQIKKNEFDNLAVNYNNEIRKSVAITGESAEFFSEYKIRDSLKKYGENHNKINILDFGCGVGNSIPFFKKYYPECSLTCADTSVISIDIAKSTFDENIKFIVLKEYLEIESNTQDLVFAACVFHHIAEKEHLFWLNELNRVLKPGGLITIYEHNPYNPLTVWAVKNSPLDENAVLIKPKLFLKKINHAGFVNCKIAYKLFFPKWLSVFRFIEDYLEPVFLGAQYLLWARKRYK